jgi:hypothetical protein
MTDTDGNPKVDVREIRYYQVPPEEKSVSQCASHGADHAAFGWCQQLDPRWNDEQIDAYRRAYATTPKPSSLHL